MDGIKCRLYNLIRRTKSLKGKLKTLAIWLILGIIFVVLLVSILDNANTKMSYSELITKMEVGEVKEIEISADGSTAYVKIDGDNIRVVLDSNDSNASKANEIMRLVQKEFDSKMYISVKFN